MAVATTSHGHFLGRLPKTEDARDITLGALKAAGLTLPPIPHNFGHGTIFRDGNLPADWGMNGNGPDDTVEPGFGGAGDCVIATKAHNTRTAAKTAGHTIQITGRSSISDYSAIGGYVIGDPSTDNGLEMRTAHGYHRATGIVDDVGARHKIAAYVSLAPGNLDELLEAAYVFSGIELGIVFTQAQDDQFSLSGPTPVWDYVAGSPELGGHSIPLYGRNAGRLGSVTWERHIWLTPALISNQVEEAWALVYLDELRNGKTERGQDLSTLQAELAALAA